MGRFSATLDLANEVDLILAGQGQLADDKVRRVQIEGVVDTGAAKLVLPESVGRELGCPDGNSITVKYADQRTATRATIHNVWLKLGNRTGAFSAVLEPQRTTALIGAIVMEELDLVADCVSGQLRPRDPDTVVAEIE